MEHNNNNDNDNSDDLYVNYESQHNDQTNIVPTTDPFAFPATESASSSNQSLSITNRSPTPFQDLLAEVIAASQVRSPPTVNNQTPAIQAQPIFSSNIHPHIDLNQAFDTNRSSSDPSASNSSPVLYDVDIHWETGQVMLDILAASTRQERDEYALRDRALSRATEMARITNRMQSHDQGVAPHHQYADVDQVMGDFVEHWVEWQNFMEIDISDVYVEIGEAVSTDGDDHDAMRLNVDSMAYEGLLDLGERIGSVSSGVTDAAIRDNMQHHKFGSSSFASSNSPNESCCICQEEYTEGEDVSTLRCRHSYHFECIKQWLVVKNSCPICKRTALPI